MTDDDSTIAEVDRIGLAFLRLIFYTRFSLMAGAILVLLGALPWMFPTPTITAVYIQSTPLRMGTTTLMSFLASAMVIMSFRTTVYNAAARSSIAKELSRAGARGAAHHGHSPLRWQSHNSKYLGNALPKIRWASAPLLEFSSNPSGGRFEAFGAAAFQIVAARFLGRSIIRTLNETYSTLSTVGKR